MKHLVTLAIAVLTLTACGDNDQSSYFGSDNAKDPPPLADNPPMSADDLDAIVNEEKNRQNSSTPATPATK